MVFEFFFRKKVPPLAALGHDADVVVAVAEVLTVKASLAVVKILTTKIIN
jgi:hypothetical protein